MAANSVPESYLFNESKNRFKKNVDGLRSYMPGHASLLEIMAARVYYTLNMCVYDGKESCVISVLRVLGYACRLAFYLTSILFVLYCTMMSSVDVLFSYSFSRDKVNDELRKDSVSEDPAVMFLWFVFALWVVSIVTCMSTYVLGRFGRQGYDTQCMSAPFCLCIRSPLPSKFGTGNRCLAAMVLLVWFAVLGAVASTTVYSIMAHIFVKRNVWFSWLLGLFTVFVFGGALADALSIGGIDGIRVTSPMASYIAAFRIVVIVPLQIVSTAAFLIATHPPWWSAI